MMSEEIIENKEYSEPCAAEKTAAIQNIRKWLELEENSHLNAKLDELSILAFLRGCKFREEKTQKKIENYYKMRGRHPELFANRDPTIVKIRELIKLGVFIPLNEYHNQRLVILIRATIHNPKTHTLDEVLKACLMVLDVAMQRHYEHGTLHGVIGIIDMKGVSLAHARQFSRSVIRKMVYAWENYYCRPKQIDFVDAPFYLNVILNIFKSFMSEKLKRRVHVHFSGVDAVPTIVDRAILPEEYGGTNGCIQDLIDYWEDVLVEKREWFAEDEKYRATTSVEI